MRQRILLFILSCGLSSAYAKIPETNLIALGEGVASPNTTLLVNIGRGLMAAENPAGLMYVEG